ncbi:MAG: hypothetical protein HY275_17405 [Gemmatimonadetes bacterium]|nr:hypothetical protein [Gemmatimonadota bacterium]
MPRIAALALLAATLGAAFPARAQPASPAATVIGTGHDVRIVARTSPRDSTTIVYRGVVAWATADTVALNTYEGDCAKVLAGDIREAWIAHDPLRRRVLWGLGAGLAGGTLVALTGDRAHLGDHLAPIISATVLAGGLTIWLMPHAWQPGVLPRRAEPTIAP